MDIILPMYNEEKVVVRTVNNLLDITYKACTIIIVDDGSTDNSLSIVCSHFSGHPRIKIVHQENSGKSIALNKGVSASNSDIIVCIDADTLVKPDVLDKILPYFQDSTVAAVSGYVKVGNRTNLITCMQYIEYVTIQNFERLVFEPMNGILVVPGALGAFRRSVVIAMGGFKTDTLAEDCDITIRMLCNNYVIKNAPSAIAFTEAPDSTRMFIKQRVRWTVGMVQGLLKHGKELLTHSNKALAYLVIPYTWIFRILLPLLAPLADYYFIGGILAGTYGMLSYYLLFILVDAMVPAFIMVKREERAGVLKWILLQRFLLRHLTLLVFIQILMKYFRGNQKGWGKIPRTGNVELE
ncbi:glycosyltransferase family 2 protein [uncultured Chitinophaga sp.]|uniref:glycosyltransferase n=1 Tax=uncultured Chitinophaga sp. TaxID=339340 RepID=UPI00260A4458|nr:glycosyltransferase family 2 protein [uncultured Chitinophaga sp.]